MNTIKTLKSYALYTLLCLVLFTSCDNKRKMVDEEYILLLTENAYLEGYKAAKLKQDRDSTWCSVSKKYRFK